MTTAINGNSAPADEPTPLVALERFYRAFNQRDAMAASHCWFQSDSVAMYNPIGGIRRGWDEIYQTYQRIMQGPVQVYVEFYDYTLEQKGDLFFAHGRERGQAKTTDDSIGLAIRTSRIFQFNENQWKQVHHHGSIDDPTMLNRYQQFLNK